MLHKYTPHPRSSFRSLALFFSVYCLWLEVMNVSWQPPKHVVTSCFYFLLKIFDVSACHFNRLFHPLCFVILGIVSCWRCLFHLFPFLFKQRCARVINLYHSYLHTVKNRRKKSSWRKKPRRISKNQQSYDSEPERQRKKEPDLNGSNLENCKSSDKKTTNYILNKVLFLCAVYDWQQCQCQRRTASLDVSLLVHTRNDFWLHTHTKKGIIISKTWIMNGIIECQREIKTATKI